MDMVVAFGALVLFVSALGVFPFVYDAANERFPGAMTWLVRGGVSALTLMAVWSAVGWIRDGDWLRLGLLGSATAILAAFQVLQRGGNDGRRPGQGDLGRS